MVRKTEVNFKYASRTQRHINQYRYYRSESDKSSLDNCTATLLQLVHRATHGSCRIEEYRDRPELTPAYRSRANTEKWHKGTHTYDDLRHKLEQAIRIKPISRPHGLDTRHGATEQSSIYRGTFISHARFRDAAGANTWHAIGIRTTVNTI